MNNEEETSNWTHFRAVSLRSTNDSLSLEIASCLISAF